MEVSKHPFVSTYTSPKDMHYCSSLFSSSGLLDSRSRSKLIKMPERSYTSVVPVRKLFSVAEESNFNCLPSEISRYSSWKTNIKLPVTFRALPEPFIAGKSDCKTLGLPNATWLQEIRQKMNTFYREHISCLVSVVTRYYEAYMMENKAANVTMICSSTNDKNIVSLVQDTMEPEVSSCDNSYKSDIGISDMSNPDFCSAAVGTLPEMKRKLQDVDREMINRKQRQINKHSKKRKRRMKKKNKTTPACLAGRANKMKNEMHLMKPSRVQSKIPARSSTDRTMSRDWDDSDEDLCIVFEDEIDGAQRILPENLHSQYTGIGEEMHLLKPSLVQSGIPPKSSENRAISPDWDDSDEDLCIVFEDEIDGAHGILPENLNSRCTAIEEMSDLWIEFDSLMIVQGNSGVTVANKSQSSDISFGCDSDSEYETDCGSIFVNTSEFDSWPGLFCINSSLVGCTNAQSGIQHPSFMSQTLSELSPFTNDEASEICKINKRWKENTSDVDRKLRLPQRVTFAPEEDLVTVFPVDVMDRKSEWEQFARERFRFKRRVEEFEKIIAPYLTPIHREEVFRKMEAAAS